MAAYAHESTFVPRRIVVFLFIILFHALLIWALANGLARKVVEVLAPPIQTDIIEEMKQDEPPPPPPPTTVPADTPPPADGDDMTAAIDAGIKKIDDTTYEIDRSLVDKVLANPMALAKGARVMPSSKNGEPNGFKLYAVRPNSVFSKLGFSNGDTLNGVNGMQLNSMDRAMEVYAKVRDASSIQVEVTRRGKPVTLNYTIR